MGYPDPTAALDAYRAPAVNAVSAPPQPPVPDPRAAQAAYLGQPMPDGGITLPPVHLEPAPNTMPTTSGEALAGVNTAVQDQQESNALQAQVQEQAAQDAASAHAQDALEAEKHAAELRTAQEEHAGAVRKLADDSESLGERSTLSKVSGIVAVALGGYQDQTNLVAGLKQGLNVQTHNADQIAHMINQGIERDIALQREKLAAHQDAESQAYASDTQALRLAHAAKIEQSQAALQQIAMTAQGENAINAVQGANAKLEEHLQGVNLDVLRAREADKARAMANAAKARARAASKGADYGSMNAAQLEALHAAGQLPAEGLPHLKKFRDLEGGGEKKLSEYREKVNAGLKPFASKDNALVRVEALLDTAGPPGKDGKAGSVDLPFYGTTRGGATWAPNLLTPSSVRQYESDVEGLAQTFIRIVSGAGIKEGEARDEIKAHGVYDSDESVSANGLRWLVSAIRGADQDGVLPKRAGPKKVRFTPESSDKLKGL